jgi:hypothetical protein
MIRHITARHDPALQAKIVRRTPLYYDDDPAEDLERPPYVRAGSSLTCIADYVAVVQDNTNFVALIDVTRGRAISLPLPAGPDGDRVFDAEHGNKRHKFDLEACMSIPGDDGPLLVAFGSGSTPERERIVVVNWRDGVQPKAQVYDGGAFYEKLRATHDFAGSELNVEGVVYLGNERIRLFQRGNGTPQDGVQPVDATCDLIWPALWRHLQAPHTPPPQPQDVVQYRLGDLRGHRLNFSDAEAVSNVILYSASAEASSQAGRDGVIAGSVLGVIDASGARYARLTSEDEDEFEEKIEGLSIGLGDPYHAYFVVDDDKDEPSALFEVELSGPWYPDKA